MAFDPDLDDAVVIALRDMIKLICARTGILREDDFLSIKESRCDRRHNATVMGRNILFCRSTSF